LVPDWDNPEIMELLNRWAELQKQVQGMQTVDSIQQRTSEQIQVLESLLAAGYSRIPGEPIDVRDLLEDRRRALQQIQGRLSRI
jgi:hypothetical protein